MKVIRHKLPRVPLIQRPPTISEEQKPLPKPKRKALLVGINYQQADRSPLKSSENKKCNRARDGNHLSREKGKEPAIDNEADSVITVSTEAALGALEPAVAEDQEALTMDVADSVVTVSTEAAVDELEPVVADDQKALTTDAADSVVTVSTEAAVDELEPVVADDQKALATDVADPVVTASTEAAVDELQPAVADDQKAFTTDVIPDKEHSDEEDVLDDENEVNEKEAPNKEPSFTEHISEEPLQDDAVENCRDGSNGLNGPHRDVLAMKQLLLDHYNYSENDIVVLMDKDEPGQIQPTRENIIQAMKDLVKDAQSGDRFFFHYAGHSTQQDTENKEEEDGKDEFLVAVDGEFIQDNELRDILVTPLPIGATLNAVFDSCHSASLLDLEHFRCNRAYVPWISKGRRKSNSRWNVNVRKQAVDLSSRHVFQGKRMTAVDIRWRQTSIDQILDSPAGYKKMSVTSKTQSLSLNVSLMNDWTGTTSPVMQCMSPVSLFCTGWCHPPSPDSVVHQPNVISLSASKDSQRAWEDGHGDSMTQALVRTLRKDPHPNLRNLLTTVSHDLHRFYLNLHSHTRSYKKKMKEYNAKQREKGRSPDKALSLEMDNFQDPQISSVRPLDMERQRWDL